MMKRILIAGGSGLIGTAISKEVQASGYEVILLSRSSGHGKIAWDPAVETIDLAKPQSFDAIINLAGSSIAGGRWTAKRKADILNSRIQSCETLRHFLQKGILKTKVYIGASGVGYYRDSGETIVDESSATQFPEDWMVQTVMKWEAAHQAIGALGIRTIITRFGIVLSTKGGALKEILNPSRFGVLACFGYGKQYWPWIHIQDVARVVIMAIEQEKLAGIILAVSPEATRNIALTKAINHELSPHRWIMPVPRFLLRLVMGEMHSVLFDSCKAFPKRLLENHFTFLFPEIENAMKDLLKNRK